MKRCNNYENGLSIHRPREFPATIHSIKRYTTTRPANYPEHALPQRAAVRYATRRRFPLGVAAAGAPSALAHSAAVRRSCAAGWRHLPASPSAARGWRRLTKKWGPNWGPKWGRWGPCDAPRRAATARERRDERLERRVVDVAHGAALEQLQLHDAVAVHVSGLAECAVGPVLRSQVRVSRLLPVANDLP